MPVLVGRDKEVAALREVMARLPTGDVLLVEGEAGIGKTALLDSAAELGQEFGARIIRVSADELFSSRPFGLFAEVTDEVPSTLVRSRASDVLFDAVVGQVTEPFVLLVDDLQWADAPSAAALPSLVRRAVREGGAVIVAYRSGPRAAEIDVALDRLRELAPRQIFLGALRPTDLDEIGRRELGDALTTDVRERLQRSGGNPMYAILLARDNTNGSTSTPDATLHEVVVRRARLLGSTAFQVLIAASLAGRRFRPQIVAAVTEMPLPTVLNGLTVAFEAGLLVDRETQFEFRHDLVRDELLATMPAAVRASLHRRMIDALRAARSPIAELVPHLLRVNVTAADADLLLAAAQATTPATALVLLDRALQVIEAGSPKHSEIAVARVAALMWSGNAPESLLAGAALLEQNLDDEFASELRSTRIRSLYLSGRAALAVDSHEPFPDSAKPAFRARELADLALAATIARRFDLGRELATRAMEISDDASAAVFALTALTWVGLRTGDLAAAFDHIDVAVARSDTVRATGTRIGPVLTRATLRHSAGDLEGALADARLGHRVIDDHTSTVLVPFLHASAGGALFDAGRWDDAATEIESGLAASDELGVRLARGWLEGLAGLLALYRAGTPFDGASTEPAGPLSIVDDRRRFATSVSAEFAGDLDEAFRVLVGCVEAVDATSDRNSLILAAPDYVRLAVELGQTDRCRHVFDALDRIKTERDEAAVMIRTWSRALLDGDVDGLARAADRHEAIRPFHVTRMRAHAALIAAGRGELTAARDLGAVALDGYRRIGAEHLVVRLAAALRARGVRVSRLPAAPLLEGWAAITATEGKILDLVADGRANQAIADELFMSRRTVESHLVHVYKKLGISSRVQLIKDLANRPPS